MDDFKKQIEAYRQEIRGDRCPFSDQELDRAIRHATWQKRLPEPTARQHKRNMKWAWAAAAACVLAVVVPVTMKVGSNADATATPEFIFSCNTGCDSQAVLARLDNILI